MAKTLAPFFTRNLTTFGVKFAICGKMDFVLGRLSSQQHRWRQRKKLSDGCLPFSRLAASAVAAAAAAATTAASLRTLHQANASQVKREGFWRQTDGMNSTAAAATAEPKRRRLVANSNANIGVGRSTGFLCGVTGVNSPVNLFIWYIWAYFRSMSSLCNLTISD